MQLPNNTLLARYCKRHFIQLVYLTRSMYVMHRTIVGVDLQRSALGYLKCVSILKLKDKPVRSENRVTFRSNTYLSRSYGEQIMYPRHYPSGHTKKIAP